MPSDIRGILLVPADGDPHGLLQEGPCGARPPMAGKHDGHWYEYESDGALGLVTEQPDGHWDSPQTDADALVLAWDGKPVAEGLDRANRVWVGRWGGVGCGAGYLLDWSVDNVREYGAALVIHLGGGTIVLLDAEGREVKSEE